MLYIVLWLIVLTASMLLFKRVAGTLSLLKPNMISIIFYYSLLVSSFIGPLLIVLDIDHYYMINKLNHKEVEVNGFFFICFIMIFIPLSMLFISKVFGFRPKKELLDYINKPAAELFENKNEFYVVFLGLSFLGIGAVVYTLLMVDRVPLFAMFQGADNLAALRISASHDFQGNTLIRNIFGMALTPLLSFAAYIYWAETNKRKWMLLFFALFIASILINTYYLAKAPIFFYILMFILVRIYVRKTILTVPKVAAIGVTGVIGIVLMYVFVMNETNISSFLSYSSGPVGRLILAQISPFYLHLDLFGREAPFLWGQSLPSTLTNLFGYEQIRSAALAMEVYFPERVKEGTAGVLNTLYAAEAYANFGYTGIILGTLYVGMIIQIIYITFLRLPKHPIFLSLFIYFTVNIPRVVVGGFMDFLFNPLWLAVTIILLSILAFLKFKVDFLSYWNRAKEHYKRT
ncbi:O-antigen polymerase [Pseudalkalibacillus sp. R45]|uniref:O-antigen polymerase n=1 Tax=Pseudalkalibacillus sp. R45 TaxID=3457433 RepID=UPI003FCC43E5